MCIPELQIRANMYFTKCINFELQHITGCKGCLYTLQKKRIEPILNSGYESRPLTTQMRIGGGWTPTFSPRCRLFKIWPKAGPPRPPFFVRVDVSWAHLHRHV